jgi:hypothetical protein
MSGGIGSLSSFAFSSNTGYNGYRDMHRASGTLSFLAKCPTGTYNFGRGVLNCDTCSSQYRPQSIYSADCTPWTARESASSQDDLEISIMFNRTIALSSDVLLSSGIAILLEWQDKISNLRDLIFDGQVRYSRNFDSFFCEYEIL